jgi:uncharacterized protein (DUF433 family)
VFAPQRNAFPVAEFLRPFDLPSCDSLHHSLLLQRLFLHKVRTYGLLRHHHHGAWQKGGKPCIRGLRVTVYDVLENLASGMTHADILRELPDLTEKDIRACLAFAADRERKLQRLRV